MKRWLCALSMLVAGPVYAGGWTNSAVPTQIEMDADRGFMVYGSFGNPSGCALQNRFYVKSDNPQYKALYAMILGASLSGRSIVAYIHGCDIAPWYSTSTDNFLSSYASVRIQ